MANNINICFFIGSFQPGGAENLVLHIVKHLNKSKMTPYVCVLSKDGSLRNEFESLNVEILEFPIKNRVKTPLEYIKFVKFLYIKNISIIHINLVGTYIFAMTAAVLAGVNKRIIHWQNAYEISRTKRHIHVRYGSLLATKIIAISNYVRKRNCEIYKIDNSKVYTLYNAIDVDYFKIDKIDNSEIIIGTVGKMTKQKGYDILLNAFSIVVKNFSNVKLEIIGSGEREREIKILIDKLRLKNNVRLLGVMPNKVVKEKMKYWTVFVLASRWEGFGIVLAEAMALGKAVVSTNVDAIPEVVEDGITGLLCPPENPSELARNILKLIKDKDKAAEMGKAGRKRVEQLFTIQKMVSELEDVYNS